MTVQDKQKQLLPLFKHLTSLTTEQLPADERDPRLKDVGVLKRGKLFSCFHEEHLLEAERLFTVLYQAKDFADLIQLSQQARDIVNEGLFVFAVSVAVLHREDCKGVTVPPIQEIFPDRFIPAETVNQALKSDRQRESNDPVVVKIQETGNILDPEYNLAYFREDIETNAHHWHWHLVYPAKWRTDVMGKAKDRKGELFYYMHQQMCARYDCDRLSSGLKRMTPFHNFHEKLEGYSPHLTSLISGLNYASRPAGLSMHDITDIDVQDMIRWRERVLDAIHVGHVQDEHGKEIPLDAEHGIDILGALLESSYDSTNRGYYGTLHNWGHVILARVHDPDGRHRENPGVMSDTSTSLRDPIFYRFHRFMDNIFQEYKATLPSYTEQELDFPDVHVAGVTVRAKVPDVVTTFMNEEELELSNGINTKGSVKVKFEHLDHESFDYEIAVENKSHDAKHATVRIFLGPKYDELGNRMTLNDQRGLYIELDKFHKELAPGKNIIKRHSKDSSVTITHIPTFAELEAGKGVSEDNSEFCSCGWPQHMLVPRGNERGMIFQLFVMLTDYTHDTVSGASEKAICSDAVSYCGAKDSKYPDKKAMGFPFDRVIHARTPAQFKTPNMSFTDVRIQHKEHH
uniref:Hemocyanin subunit 5a n=1 Tax=Pandinus imperator TaxID=55084 RepID=C6H100_PANIM|nr:hemocyanin subunit 5a [Pandinus imperator]